MQTFLPYQDFALSASALDNKRLGKQRVETLQIMKALMTGRGWISHPATLMWRKYEWALLEYQEAICFEWSKIRGHEDTCLEKTRYIYRRHRKWREEKIFPYWLGELYFHASHQSNLKRKDPTYYSHLFPNVSNNLDYVWPLPEEQYLRLRKKILWVPQSRAKQSL